MKKIINGKKYDTDTAKFLGYWTNGLGGDFRHVREELYRKKTGEYFLYGLGGPMSKYASCVSQNCWGGGEQITPLTEEKAKKWAEMHLSVDEYEAIFGDVEE